MRGTNSRWPLGRDRDFENISDGPLGDVLCLSRCFLTIWFHQALSRAKVDGFVPHTQHLNLRKVTYRDFENISDGPLGDVDVVVLHCSEPHQPVSNLGVGFLVSGLGSMASGSGPRVPDFGIRV